MVTVSLRQVGTFFRRSKLIGEPALFDFEPEGAGTSKRPFRLVSPDTAEANLTVHALELKRQARRSTRKSVLMRATLICTDGAQTVRLRDLTRDGAGIACQVPLQTGSDVILRRGELFIAARVAWTDGMAAGLDFYRPVDMDEVSASFMLA